MRSTEGGNKIVVIGAGNVGETICYTLMLKTQVSEIVLIDLNEDRAKGVALDISHGTAYYSQVKIRKGGYSECADADIIIVTAGVPRKEGQTRLDLAKTNTGVARSIARSIMEYADNPIIIVVSNPVDVNTYLIQKETGLPRGRVIGTGTSLDTARFRYLLSRHCKVDIRDIQGYILGEHGDSQVPVWSTVNIAGEAVEHFLPSDPEEAEKKKAEIATKARTAGADVISLKGATFDGIAMSVLRIVESILKDQNTVLPVSHVLEENFGFHIPGKMREDVGYTVKDVSDKRHQELVPKDILKVFKEVYVNIDAPHHLKEVHFVQKKDGGIEAEISLDKAGVPKLYHGRGNGRLDALSNALRNNTSVKFDIMDYKEHSLSKGSTSKAVSYVKIKDCRNLDQWGVGIHEDIITSSVLALFSALNRALKQRRSQEGKG